MTRVRRSARGRLTFISHPRVGTRQARLHNKRPGGDAGRSVPPRGLVTQVFSGSDLKSFSVASAAAISHGAVAVSRRRAHNQHKQVISSMQPDTNDEIGAATEGGRSRYEQSITGRHRSPQVVVRSFGGSSEGEGGTPLPLERPSTRVYHIEDPLPTGGGVA